MNAGDALLVHYALERQGFSLDVALEVPLTGITGLFGASGAGKTTLLRCIAGLEQSTGGKLIVAGEHWEDSDNRRPVHLREIGYVFQEPRLFAHLDVRGNLDYGRRRSGTADRIPAFEQVVDLLGLEPLLDRMPRELSGGEAQRVAIGRALLRAPRLMLMDEPLASLDAARKEEILPFLDRLHAELSTPIIYVSHNIEEVCRLCDHLVVMEQGRVAAHGELQSVLASIEVPAISGEDAGAVIFGEVAGYDADYDLTTIRFSGGELRVSGCHGQPGSRSRLRIRANDVSLCREAPQQTTILNVLPAKIDAMQAASGAALLLRLDIGSEILLARVTRRSCEDLNLKAGDEVYAQIKAVAVREPRGAD